MKRHGVPVLSRCPALDMGATGGCGDRVDPADADAGVGVRGREEPAGCWVCTSAHEGSHSTTYEYDERGNLTRYVSLEGDDKLDSCEFQYDA